LLKNGYPLQFIDNQICRFMNKKHQIQQSSNNQLPKPHISKVLHIIFKLPYIGDPSLHIQKELRNFFRKKLQNQLQISTVHLTNKLGNF